MDVTPRQLRIWRSVALFTVGILGVIYEVVVEHSDKPTLLILLGAMMGLPAFLSVDEKRKRDSKNGDEEKPK